MHRSALFLLTLLCSLAFVDAPAADAGGFSLKKVRRSFKKRVKEVDKAACKLKKSRLVVKTRRELDRAGQTTRDTTRAIPKRLGFGYRTTRKPVQVAHASVDRPPTLPPPATYTSARPAARSTPTPVCPPVKPDPC